MKIREDLLKIIIYFLLIAVLLSALVLFLIKVVNEIKISQSHEPHSAPASTPEPSPAPTPTPTPKPTPTPTPTPTPKPTPTPTPKPSYSPFLLTNGMELISPDYERLCPLTVTADADHDCYIYLEYCREPQSSYVSRSYVAPDIDKNDSDFLRKFLTRQDDLSFCIRAGRSVDLLVPIGIYKMYIASASKGSAFYGSEYLFGDLTSCTVAAEELEFYADSTSYIGHTIILEHSYDGNLEERGVKMSDFPGVGN